MQNSKIINYLTNNLFIQNLIVIQLLNKLPVCFGTNSFIIVFTKARHWSVSGPELNQSITFYFVFCKIYFNSIYQSVPVLQVACSPQVFVANY
jgi:hypothetical protein